MRGLERKEGPEPYREHLEEYSGFFIVLKRMKKKNQGRTEPGTVELDKAQPKQCSE